MNKFPWIQRALEQINKGKGSTSAAYLITLPEAQGGVLLKKSIIHWWLYNTHYDDLESKQQLGSKELNEQQHPDAIVIDTKGDWIKIDDIRYCLSRVQRSAQKGGMQVIAITSAHKLTISAANALLKQLEEPKQQLRIVLQSDNPERILATIRSRCILLHFEPSSQEAKEYCSKLSPDVCHWYRYYRYRLYLATDDAYRAYHELVLERVAQVWILATHSSLNDLEALHNEFSKDHCVQAAYWILYILLCYRLNLGEGSRLLFKMKSGSLLQAYAGNQRLSKYFMAIHLLNTYQEITRYGIASTNAYHVESLYLRVRAALQ